VNWAGGPAAGRLYMGADRRAGKTSQPAGRSGKNKRVRLCAVSLGLFGLSNPVEDVSIEYDLQFRFQKQHTEIASVLLLFTPFSRLVQIALVALLV
jgi:hypothetical protein